MLREINHNLAPGYRIAVWNLTLQDVHHYLFLHPEEVHFNTNQLTAQYPLQSRCKTLHCHS